MSAQDLAATITTAARPAAPPAPGWDARSVPARKSPDPHCWQCRERALRLTVCACPQHG